MLIPNVLIALAVAAGFWIVLWALIRDAGRRGRGVPGAGGLIGLFALLFLGAWAGGLWFPVVAATPWMSAWFPFLMAGLLVFMLVMLLLPGWPEPRSARETVLETDEPPAVGPAFGLLFIVAGITILAGLVLLGNLGS